MHISATITKGRKSISHKLKKYLSGENPLPLNAYGGLFLNHNNINFGRQIFFFFKKRKLQLPDKELVATGCWQAILQAQQLSPLAKGTMGFLHIHSQLLGGWDTQLNVP